MAKSRSNIISMANTREKWTATSTTIIMEEIIMERPTNSIATNTPKVQGKNRPRQIKSRNRSRIQRRSRIRIQIQSKRRKLQNRSRVQRIQSKTKTNKNVNQTHKNVSRSYRRYSMNLISIASLIQKMHLYCEFNFQHELKYQFF